MIRPATSADEGCAGAMLAEYCDALEIVVRDSPAEIRDYLVPPSGLWFAQAGTDVAGCIALRPLTDTIGEINQLRYA